MFIVRMVFWVGVIALLLPAAPESNAAAPASNFGGKDAVAVAMATGSDVMGFCGRNRSVCDLAERTGTHIFHQVTYYGEKLAEWAFDAAVEVADKTTAPRALDPSV